LRVGLTKQSDPRFAKLMPRANDWKAARLGGSMIRYRDRGSGFDQLSRSLREPHRPA
jgi:hypothetical protein